MHTVISEHDSAEDAIYIHTPNPNQDNFPLSLKAIATPNFKNKQLQDYLNSLTALEKLYGSISEENFCILCKKEVGQELNIDL